MVTEAESVPTPSPTPSCPVRVDRVLITGACGFIGRRLVQRMLDDSRFADSRFTLTDVVGPGGIDTDARVRWVEGDIGDPAVIEDLTADAPTTVIHLAGMLGAAAENDPRAARRVNIDATLELLERLRSSGIWPRLVSASSIAVFGTAHPASVNDESRPNPTMIYGAHKLMTEVAIEQSAARGWVDGYALRLPGIVARRDADSRQRSAFLNALFFACEEAARFTLPVGPEGTSWLLSVEACVDALIHAVMLPPGLNVSRRAFTLPALRVTVGELVDGLADRFPHSRGLVNFDADPELHAQFASQPPLVTDAANSLGFRHDGDLATLIARALHERDTEVASMVRATPTDSAVDRAQILVESRLTKGAT